MFVNRDNSYTGTGRNDREWRIKATHTGWHLEFRDPGDAEATYAGTHRTLDAAQQEACW
jgi:hypothetical protein